MIPMASRCANSRGFNDGPETRDHEIALVRDPEARFARTLIEFDPRRAPLAQISAEHCPSTARIRRSVAERQPRELREQTAGLSFAQTMAKRIGPRSRTARSLYRTSDAPSSWIPTADPGAGYGGPSGNRSAAGSCSTRGKSRLRFDLSRRFAAGPAAHSPACIG
jgi:hypothetical protein